MYDANYYGKRYVIWWKGFNVSFLYLFATVCCLAKFSLGQTIILELQRPFDLTGKSRQTCCLGLPWGIVRLLPPGSRAGSSRNWVGFLISGLSRRRFWIISIFLKMPTKYLQHPVYFSEWNYQKRIISYTCSPVAGWFVKYGEIKYFLKDKCYITQLSAWWNPECIPVPEFSKRNFNHDFLKGKNSQYSVTEVLVFLRVINHKPFFILQY